jgi:hypothetical protein
MLAKRITALRQAILGWIRPPGVFRFDTILAASAEIRAVLADPRHADPLRLERSGYRVYSQFDEDGIIAEIFRRIGETARTFVEFGAGDGFENCTAFLLFQGWSGLWIEGDPKRVETIRAARAKEIAAGKLSVRQALVTPDNIDSLIASAGFNGEIDLLSVDIDGNDHHVLERIEIVRPRVVVVEYNAKFPPPLKWVMPRDDRHVWDESDQSGASLAALHEMMASRGYALVGCSIAGVNAFFVRKDLADGKFAEPFDPENHYQPPRYYLAPGFYVGHPARKPR